MNRGKMRHKITFASDELTPTGCECGWRPKFKIGAERETINHLEVIVKKVEEAIK
jgi:hypothetical protein